MHPSQGPEPKRHLREVVDVTVVIPTIPERPAQLIRAMTSVHVQSVQPSMLLVERDLEHTGAAASRNRALKNVTTEWVAFLDDDDMLYADHLRLCLAKAIQDDADVVYPWFDLTIDGEVCNDQNPLAAPKNGYLRTPFGLKFGDEQKRHLMEVSNFIPVTVLARTELLIAAGGFPEDGEHEDWELWRTMLGYGDKFVHLPQRTWCWRWHPKQTGGRVGK